MLVLLHQIIQLLVLLQHLIYLIPMDQFQYLQFMILLLQKVHLLSHKLQLFIHILQLPPQLLIHLRYHHHLVYSFIIKLPRFSHIQTLLPLTLSLLLLQQFQLVIVHTKPLPLPNKNLLPSSPRNTWLHIRAIIHLISIRHVILYPVFVSVRSKIRFRFLRIINPTF